jgi:hypothetical protein
LFDVGSIAGQFDMINWPRRIAPPRTNSLELRRSGQIKLGAGIFHIFVYGELEFEFKEIKLMMRAIALLQGDKRGDFRDRCGDRARIV